MQKVSEKGFTLIELVVVMAILAIVAALTAPSMMNEINERRASISIEETQLIMDAARSYRISNGTWPGNATCSNALTVLKGTTPPMLSGVSTTNRYNSPYSTSCTATSFSLDQNAVQDWDGYIVNGLAGTEIVNAGTSQLRTTIGIPGSEPAMDSKLSRIATGNAELNRMRTTLLLGGNDITEVDEISAVTGKYTGTLTVAQATALNGALAVKGTSQFTGTANFNNVANFNSTANFNSNVTFDAPLQLRNALVADNQNCAAYGAGAIARGTGGALFACQGGVWKNALSGGDMRVASCMCTTTGCHCNPTCPAGYTLINSTFSGIDSNSHRRNRMHVGLCKK